MSDRYPGGIISKTPVTPTGPYQDGTAPGIWTLEQQAYWKAQGLWPIAGNANPGDPYYKYVTMLLTGDGTNGAQNNTFVDSSTNAFTMTRTGNFTQGSFSPYGSNWSNYFNGSTDYLSLSTTATLGFGTGDFTIEMWHYSATSSTSPMYLFDLRTADGSYGAPAIYTNNGSYEVYVSGGGSKGTVTPFTWTHIALVRSSGTTTFYVNGTSTGSFSDSNNYGSSCPLRIASGAGAGGLSYKFNGYISNFRIVKGTAVYTSAFTPSTTPLTAVSGTSLLTCQSNRFIDNSSNAYAITVNGSPSVQRLSPFNPTASYSTATIGGSGYMPVGVNRIQSSTSNYTFSGDFTVEMWLYPTALTPDANFFSYRNGDNYPSDFGILWAAQNDYINFQFIRAGSGGWNIAASNVLYLNRWTHLAVSRSGSSVKMFANGVEVSSTTQSSDVNLASAYYEIGARVSEARFGGYISDVRVNNTALYTTTFTPPTAPLTAVSGTQLLCNMTNAGIPDSAMMNDLETVGNAQVSTSVKKFGTGSLKFSGSSGGTTDCILASAPASPLYSPSSSFTVEFWIYPLGTGDTNQYWVGNYNASNNGWDLRYQDLGNAVNGVSYENTASSKVIGFTSAAISSNTWQFITASWDSSGNCYVFVNGVLLRTLTGFSTTTNDILNIGRQRDVSNRFFQGYIDDLRITKGYARYTTTFTPPTSAFYTY